MYFYYVPDGTVPQSWTLITFLDPIRPEYTISLACWLSPGPPGNLALRHHRRRIFVTQLNSNQICKICWAAEYFSRECVQTAINYNIYRPLFCKLRPFNSPLMYQLPVCTEMPNLLCGSSLESCIYIIDRDRYYCSMYL